MPNLPDFLAKLSLMPESSNNVPEVCRAEDGVPVRRALYKMLPNGAQRSISGFIVPKKAPICAPNQGEFVKFPLYQGAFVPRVRDFGS
jgi:hypothetical protein